MSPAARARRAPGSTRAPRVDPPQWEFSDRLRKIRRDVAQVEQGPFAEMIGVGRPAYATYEAGRARPRNIEMFALAVEHVTGVPKEWLLWGDAGDGDARPSHVPDPVLPSGAPATGHQGDVVAAADLARDTSARPAAASAGDDSAGPNAGPSVPSVRVGDVDLANATKRASCASPGQGAASRAPLAALRSLGATSSGPIVARTPYSSDWLSAA